MKIGGIYAEVRATRNKLKGDLDAAEKDVDASAGKMGKSIASIGFKAAGVAAVAFGAAVAAAIKQGVESSAELERKMLRTEAIIKSTGNAAQLSSKQMLDLANRLDLATLNNRDQILDGINAMQTFKSVSGETFERSIELAVDLAEVMGTDLRSQVVQLGKALEDPKTGLSALRRVGVSFTDAQKEMITALVESNKTLEAQGLILDAIAGQVGGAAAGSAGGLSGKVDTLSFRWRGFTEALAESTGAIESTAAAIEMLANALGSLTDWIKGPSVAEKLDEEIARMEKAFARNANNPAFTEGVVGQQMRKRLESARMARFRISEYGDYNFTPGAGTDSGGSGGGETTDSEPPGKNLFGMADDYKDSWLEQAEERYDILSRQYEAEIELESQRIEDAKALNEDFWQYQIEGTAAAAQRAVDIEEWQKEKRKKIGLDTVKNFGNALQLMGQQQRWAFEAYKVYQTAEAVITGIAAAVKAWDAGMSTGGPWAPYVAAAYAASSLAWTAAQVSAIQSASFQGGSGGSAPSSGAVGTYNANPTTGVFEPADDEKRGTMTINVYGDISDPESFVDAFVDKINDAADRDVFINYSRGLRAA